MNTRRLSRLKSTLDRFVLKAGRRLMIFENYEKRQAVKAFNKKIADGIADQMIDVMKASLDEIWEGLDKISEADANRIRRVLKSRWQTFTEYVDGGDVVEFLTYSGNAGGQAAVSHLGARGTFLLKNKPLLNKLEKRSTFLIDSLDETNMLSLQNTVIEGIERDMTMTEMKSFISGRISDEISPYRAEMITRTEFANAASLVSGETYKKNGVEKWEWVTAPNECDICAGNDGEKRSIGDTFSSGDDRPPVHPNCKCDIVPVIPEDWDASDAWLGD